jgi:hypothetical protein
MYRPTVRYDDCFKEYVDEVFHATSLDRNQIMRLALFLLGHTKEGKDVLTHFATSPLPEPKWNKNNMVVWYGKDLNLTLLEEGGGVTSDVKESGTSGHKRQTARPDDRQVHQETKKRIKYIARVGDNTTILYQQ